MSFLSRRVRFVAFGLGVAFAGGVSHGATFSMKAVSVNGVPLDDAPASIVNAMPGDRIEAEVYLRGWNENLEGGLLKTFQFGIDGLNNFFVSEADNLNVALPGCYDRGTVVKCEVNGDCPLDTPICPVDLVCQRSCNISNNVPLCVGGSNNGLSCVVAQSLSDCPGGRCVGFNSTDCLEAFPACTLRLLCVGVNHDPDACTFADLNRSDFALFGLNSIDACGFTGVDISCGATTLGGGAADTGKDAYVGTVTIDLTLSACGTIIPAFTSVGTFIELLPAFGFIPATEPLTINVIDNPVCTGCATIIDSVPENCSVDARIPHAMDAANPKFWFSDDFDFELTFNNEPEGGFMQSDFSISIEPIHFVIPSIDSFSVDASGKIVTISVNRPPSLFSPPRWMCINFVDPNPVCDDQKLCWARLPGDVNGNNTIAGNDLTALIAGLNSGGLSTTRCDMDRSGACQAPDLLMWINLANGADAFQVWLDQEIQECPSALP